MCEDVPQRQEGGRGKQVCLKSPRNCKKIGGGVSGRERGYSQQTLAKCEECPGRGGRAWCRALAFTLAEDAGGRRTGSTGGGHMGMETGKSGAPRAAWSGQSLAPPSRGRRRVQWGSVLSTVL